MKYSWLKFPQVVDILDQAAVFARNDGSSRISEWHLMLSLLRFNSVWSRFKRQQEFQARLFEAAERHSDRRGGDKPRPGVKLLADFFSEAERLRARGDQALPSPSHFVLALLSAGTAELRQIAFEFDFDDRLEGERDDDDCGDSGDSQSDDEDRHVPKSDAEALERFTVELVAREAKRR